MKFLIVLVAVVALVAGDSYEPPPKVVAAFTDCQKETGASDERRTQIQSHNFNFDDDHAGHCYVKCIGLQLGSTDKDFNIVTDDLEKKHPTIVEQVSCLNVIKGIRLDCNRAF